MSIKNIALAASMIAFGAFAVSAQAADVAAPAASAAAATASAPAAAPAAAKKAVKAAPKKAAKKAPKKAAKKAPAKKPAKKDAEKDKNNNEVFLKDVEFKLEKLNGNGVDATFNNNAGSMPGTTGGDGDNAGKCSFTNLSEGSYRLTELKTVDGYNLLAAPIEFTLQNGKCLINGETQNIVEGDAAKGYKVSLTINNRKGFTLPHTGADAPSLWLLIGMPLAVAGLLIFTFRYNRKGGRRH